MVLICKYCNKEFEWKNVQKRYCSEECKILAKDNTKLKEYERICPVCKKGFVAHNSRAKYCSHACNQKSCHERNKKEYIHKCFNCGKEFISFEKKTKFCCLICAGEHKNKIGIGIKYNCKQCGKEFYQTHKRHYYCCNECKIKYGLKHAPTREVFCSNCGKSIQRIRTLKRDNFFCSRKCESGFREKEANDIRICKGCGKEFTCKKSELLIFCSKKCQIIGLSKKPTVPHCKIIGILEKLSLNFEIEFPIKRYSIDNYLIDFDLGIEVMGSFWHTDIRLYNNPSGKRQLSDIKKDKKRSKDLKILNVPVLYLWEYDINNNIQVCEDLILYFIKNNGILNNYHSMNYHINNADLELNKIILIPYFELENDYISPLTTGTREIHSNTMDVEQSGHTLLA